MKFRVGSFVGLVAFATAGPPAFAQAPVGGEFQVNTYTTDSQYYPAVASDAEGGFVVAWSHRPASAAQGVFARRFDASGMPRGPEFRVNTYTGDQGWPAVASDAAGNFIVTWLEMAGNWSGMDVYARRYDAAGAPLGAIFQVNTYTTGPQYYPSVDFDAAGNFVVAWQSWQDGAGTGIVARRYSAAGTPRGAEFLVNTYITFSQYDASVAVAPDGGFLVTWVSVFQDGGLAGIFGRRFGPSGVPLGSEFRVNTHTTSWQFAPAAASDDKGNFVVAWQSAYQDGSATGVYGQRYDSTAWPRGSEFRVNTHTLDIQGWPSVAYDSTGNLLIAWESVGQDADRSGIFAQRYDASGSPLGAEFQVNTHMPDWQWDPAVAAVGPSNFVVVWTSDSQDGHLSGVFGQRFGDFAAAALAVDPAASPASDGNGVLEPGETVEARPSWTNLTGISRTVSGTGLGFAGPPAPGVGYTLPDATAAYGSMANGSTAQCSDCYRAEVTFGGTRPAVHWDATLTERLVADTLVQTRPWLVHVGESFPDVPKASLFYLDVETLLHRGVTAGCAASSYCPGSPVTRDQMAAFVLLAKEGAGYRAAACSPPNRFLDVPETSPFCDAIEELSRRGVVTGCGSNTYCPAAEVTREQMPVFVLRLLEPTLDPQPCTTPLFADVPASSPFCRWIEELARRGVVAGCGGGNYCPAAPVARDQMAVFLTGTYGLGLYDP
jgi:hypothetical protein